MHLFLYLFLKSIIFPSHFTPIYFLKHSYLCISFLDCCMHFCYTMLRKGLSFKAFMNKYINTYMYK